MGIFGTELQTIQWHNNSGESLVYRWPQQGSTDITFGSQLIVQETQSAIFYRDGKDAEKDKNKKVYVFLDEARHHLIP